VLPDELLPDELLDEPGKPPLGAPLFELDEPEPLDEEPGKPPLGAPPPVVPPGPPELLEPLGAPPPKPPPVRFPPLPNWPEYGPAAALIDVPL
jgi:hypothetical protein